MALDTKIIRDQFPLLSRKVHEKSLVYLDNAATTQKPQVVLDALTEYYTQHNANVHRGIHTLGDESTKIYHESRKKIAGFFSALPEEFIAVRNTTEATNLLAQFWQDRVQKGDVIVTTFLEHHSHFIPWQRIADEKGAEFLILPLTDDGLVDWDAAKPMLKKRAKKIRIVALTHLSNALGTLVDPTIMDGWLREWGVRDDVRISLDAAQSAGRMAIEFRRLGVDALSFSGHKLYGPMGIGGLIMKKEELQTLEPVLWGGGMIDAVTAEASSAAESLEDRFTAGTPDVASLYGLATALEWLKSLGMADVRQHDSDLVSLAYTKLSQLPGVTVVGPSPKDHLGKTQRLGSVSCIVDGVHAHDVAQILDRSGVAVRSGHHCTMPLHHHQNWIATTRASFGVYSRPEEVDALVHGLEQIKKTFLA
jgi:cysteine desulfurase/selenocysteine lyase